MPFVHLQNLTLFEFCNKKNIKRGWTKFNPIIKIKMTMTKGANNAFHPICLDPTIIMNIWFVPLHATNARTIKGHMSPCLNLATRKTIDHKGGQTINFASCFGTSNNKWKKKIRFIVNHTKLDIDCFVANVIHTPSRPSICGCFTSFHPCNNSSSESIDKLN